MFRKLIDGEQAGNSNIKQEHDGKSEDNKFDESRKPKLLTKAPQNCKFPRLWHFLNVFPFKEFEYCTQASLDEKFGQGKYQNFHRFSFLQAWLTSCRLGVSTNLGYSQKHVWGNQCPKGRAFSNLPRDTYKAQHASAKGHLSNDRELYLGSIIGARNREFGVVRLKGLFLDNCRASREAPIFSAVDEKNIPYTGKISGLKKQLAKKVRDGMEYFCICCSNKGYEGQKEEVKDKDNKVIQTADPIAGGFPLFYTMAGGIRYEVGVTTPSKMFGIMMLMVFRCGLYLRNVGHCIVTDSAYCALEGLLFFALWEINFVTSVRMGQRRGYLGVKEIMDAGAEERRANVKKKSKKNASSKKSENKSGSDQRTIKSDVRAFEKKYKDSPKGTSFFWKASIEILKGLVVHVQLTCIVDSKFCQRLDNFLGPMYRAKMKFQNYIEEPGHRADNKAKSIVEASIAKVHKIFRLRMGAVDQDSVKAKVQGVSREMAMVWSQKQLAHIVECAVSAAHCSYNIDDYDVEYFTDQHDNFLDELEANAKNYRKRVISQTKLVFEESESPRKRLRKSFTPKKKRSVINMPGTRTSRGISCPAIGPNLAAAFRFSPVEGTGKSPKPKMRRQKCAFCGRPKTTFMCV